MKNGQTFRWLRFVDPSLSMPEAAKEAIGIVIAQHAGTLDACHQEIMSLEEIKTAVESGKGVYWSNNGYRVIKDNIGQWLIEHCDGHCIGLTHRDGKTMNGNPEDFFIE